MFHLNYRKPSVAGIIYRLCKWLNIAKLIIIQAAEKIKTLCRINNGSDVNLSNKYRAIDGRDYKNYFLQVRNNYAPFSNNFEYYKLLINRISELESTKILPLYELADATSKNYKLIGLRHDIDADPLKGLKAARYLARYGICGTFYLLHTAVYYGEFYDGIFIRNPRLVDWVKGFILSGAELGLHNDALGTQYHMGIDYKDILRTELTWLRSQGATIRGTCAHNSIASYGAENYEVFNNNVLWNRTVTGVKKKNILLGELDSNSLGLAYEGTFAKPKIKINKNLAREFASDCISANIRDKEWMYRYLMNNPCCDWSVDYQAWLLGKDLWVVAGVSPDNKNHIFEWNINLDSVIKIIKDIPLGSRLVLVIHPEYFDD